MNTDDRQQLIEEKMDELPPFLKEAIDSSGWEKKIFDIGRKHQLHIDDLEYLQSELAFAIVGLSDQGQFSSRVQGTLGLDDETMDKIVEDINDEIFADIREHIKEEVFEDEKEKFSESGLSESEESEMQKAGVSFGEEAAPSEPESEMTPPATAIPAEEKPAPVVQKENPAPKPIQSGVFKTKISAIDATDKPKNFLDPYREPIE